MQQEQVGTSLSEMVGLQKQWLIWVPAIAVWRIGA
jgi:hypothetical protein